MSHPRLFLFRHEFILLLADQFDLPPGAFTLSFDYDVDSCGVVYISRSQQQSVPLKDLEGKVMTGRALRKVFEPPIDLPSAISLTVYVPQEEKGLVTFSLRGLLKLRPAG